jgi:hypothetical protein
MAAKDFPMRFSLLLATLALLLAGCGGSNIASVSGRVTLDNKPLANATVTFHPDSNEFNPGPGSQGKTDGNGEYTLKLLTKDVNGAVLGKHKVSITAYNEIAAAGQPAHRKGFGTPLVPPEYNAKTTLTFEVLAGGNPNANFDLLSEPPKQK